MIYLLLIRILINFRLIKIEFGKTSPSGGVLTQTVKTSTKGDILTVRGLYYLINILICLVKVLIC